MVLSPFIINDVIPLLKSIFENGILAYVVVILRLPIKLVLKAALIDVLAPLIPVCPLSPVGPVEPVFDAYPGSPVYPCGPVKPVTPVGPVEPVFVAIPANH